MCISVAGALLCGCEDESKVVAPVDLNKPVTNPALVKVISVMQKNPSAKNQKRLLLELNNAVFLLATFKGGMKIEKNENGDTVIKKGSLIQFISTEDESGNPILLAYTDWDGIKRSTKEAVDTVVMPAAKLWDFAQDHKYSGVLIFIGKDELLMNKKHLEKLKSIADPDDKLQRLITAMEDVPLKPAKSFYEAMVATNFMWYIDDTDSIGRFDQFLYPYFKKDMDAGIINREEVVELLRNKVL